MALLSGEAMRSHMSSRVVRGWNGPVSGGVSRRRRGVAFGALATATVLALTACGSASGSNSASGSSGGAAASSGPALTGTPISIGVISSLSGPQASSSNQADTVAPAWAEWVNANGGLNGHPVKIISVDDGG